ncbi:MAG: hypothetical protein INR68_07455 [Methylobacterium mesophilicum]|nr:hypothetical protein [Methylobacterium mesophilicum]
MGAQAEFLVSALTTLVLYLMLGIPFAVWSGKISHSSASAEVEGRPRGKPGRGATLFLLILPLALIVFYFISGIGRVGVDMLDVGFTAAPLRKPASEWGAYAFLALSPALGSILGYVMGAILAGQGKTKS